MINRNHASPISVDELLHIHGLLMKNAINKSKKALLTGKFRDCNLHSTGKGHCFPPFGQMEQMTKIALDHYEAHRVRLSPHGVSLRMLIRISTRLFYEIITAHPFPSSYLQTNNA